MFKTSTVFILHFNPACVLLSVCGLHFTLSLHFTPGPQSAVHSLRFTLTENVTTSRIALRYHRDSVTVISTVPSLQTYVMSRAVTEQIVTRSRRLVAFSVPK